VAATGCRLIAASMLALVFAEACGAGWHGPVALPRGPLPVRQQVQVWHHGQVLRWHAVFVAPDSVSGVPFLQPVDCDTCRVSLARDRIDSLRVGNPVAGFWKTFALVVGAPVLTLVIICATSGKGGVPCSD
jgi:hypothetical protein